MALVVYVRSLLAVFLGAGLEGVVGWALARRPRSGLPAIGVAVAVAVALAMVPVVTAVVDHPRASQHGNVADQARIERAIAAAGHHAVLRSDNYQDSEYLWYYVIGEGLGRRRELVVSNGLSVDDVVTYFEGGEGRLATDAATLARPGRPRVLTTTRGQATALRAAGLHVIRLADGVWEIAGFHRARDT